MSRLPVRRFWWFAAGSALSVAVFVAWVLANLGGAQTVTWMDDLGELAAALIAGIACIWIAYRGHGRRWPWRWLGASALSWAAGEAVWSWYELIKGVTVPFPSPADVGFLAAVPLAVVAILMFPTSPTATSSRVRMVLDGLIVAGSLLFVSWATALGAVYRSGSGGIFEQAIGLAYPLGDVVVGAVVLAVLARAQRRDRVTLAMIGAGLLALAVADSAFAYLTQNNAFNGGLIDVGWIIGYLMIGLAALWSATTVHRHEPILKMRASTLQVLIPYIPLCLAGFVAVAKAITGGTFDSFLIVDGLVVITVVLGRQLAMLLENVGLAQVLHTTVAELRAREDQLAHQAFHDPLTNLANRLLLADRIEHALGRQRRTAESVAVLICDLDDFKAINDTLGHLAGDELLVAIAERLLACVRPGDTVARLGGDEFALLLDGISLPGYADAVAQRVVDAMRVPFRVSGRELFVHISVGVAVAEPDCDTTDLLRQADVALYVAKDAGRDRYQFFELHMLDTVVGRVELQAELGAASSGPGLDRFYLDYQPIFEVEEGRIVGYEALMRWNHPTRGVLLPVDFLAYAEESGTIVAIASAMLDKACRQGRRWHDDVQTPLDLNFPISGRLLHDADLMTIVRQALLDSGLPAERLVLEISAATIMKEGGTALAQLHQLKTLGVQLAIDNFGATHISLELLQKLPVDMINIDRTVVADLNGTPDQAVLIDAITSLAKSFGLRVTAAGVETAEQYETITRLGCHRAQGDFLGHPAAARMIPPATLLGVSG